MASAFPEQAKSLHQLEFNARSDKADEEVLFLNVRKYLEEVTPLNLYSPLVKIRNLPITYSVTNLERLVLLIFEKVVNIPTGNLDYVRAYCELCRHLVGPTGITAIVIEGGLEYTLEFKQVLITLVVKEFEKLSTGLTRSEMVNISEEESKLPMNPEEKQHHSTFSLRDGEKKNELSQRMNGSLRFLNELYKSKLLTSGIVFKCIGPFLNTPKVEFLVPLIGLLLNILWENADDEEAGKPITNGSLSENEKLLKEFLKKIFEIAQEIQGSKKILQGANLLKDLIYPPPKKNPEESLETDESQPAKSSQQGLDSQPQVTKGTVDPEKIEKTQTKEEKCEDVVPSKNVKIRNKKKKKTLLEDNGKEWKLKTVEYPWKPARLMKADNRSKKDKENEEFMKKVRGILNRLTSLNLATQSQRFNGLPFKSESRLSKVADIIFDKAVSEPLYTKDYVYLCLNFPRPMQKNSLRKMIVAKCQIQFEDFVSPKSIIPDLIEKIQNCTDPVEKEKLELNLIEAEIVKQSCFTGLMRVIGESYILGMLTPFFIRQVFGDILDNPRDDTVEALCTLLNTCGQCYDEHWHLHLNAVYSRILKLIKSNDKKISMRSRRLLKTSMKFHQRKDKVYAELQLEQNNMNLSIRLWMKVNQTLELQIDSYRQIYCEEFDDHNQLRNCLNNGRAGFPAKQGDCTTLKEDLFVGDQSQE